MKEIIDFIILVLEILLLLIKASVIGYVFTYLIYIFLLNKLVYAIKEENRLIQPSKAWFLLIPGYSLIYQFYFYSKLFKSMRNELNTSNHHNYLRKEENFFLVASIVNIITAIGFAKMYFDQEFTPIAIIIFIINLTMLAFKLINLKIFEDNFKMKQEMF